MVLVANGAQATVDNSNLAPKGSFADYASGKDYKSFDPKSLINAKHLKQEMVRYRAFLPNFRMP